jgi:hypothetical protein
MINECNYIISIEINCIDGDRIVLKRPINPYNGIHEPHHRERWLEMLKGHIEDIQQEIELIKKEIKI